MFMCMCDYNNIMVYYFYYKSYNEILMIHYFTYDAKDRFQ